MSSSVEDLLAQLEERASTARTIFMLLDSDADGLVAVEQVSSPGLVHLSVDVTLRFWERS